MTAWQLVDSICTTDSAVGPEKLRQKTAYYDGKVDGYLTRVLFFGGVIVMLVMACLPKSISKQKGGHVLAPDRERQGNDYYVPY